MHTKLRHIYYIQYAFCLWMCTCLNINACRVGKPSYIWAQNFEGLFIFLLEIDSAIFFLKCSFLNLKLRNNKRKCNQTFFQSIVPVELTQIWEGFKPSKPQATMSTCNMIKQCYLLLIYTDSSTYCNVQVEANTYTYAILRHKFSLFSSFILTVHLTRK